MTVHGELGAPSCFLRRGRKPSASALAALKLVGNSPIAGTELGAVFSAVASSRNCVLTHRGITFGAVRDPLPPASLMPCSRLTGESERTTVPRRGCERSPFVSSRSVFSFSLSVRYRPRRKIAGTSVRSGSAKTPIIRLMSVNKG